MPVSAYRFFFTVTAGRSGQSSLSELLTRHVAGCHAAFEEPQINPALPFPFRTLEQRFRRRFVETHELLGRGKVLTAFESGDHAYLEAIARRRLRLAERELEKSDATIYFDVSKFYARGLHAGFARAIPEFGLLRLVRDPVRNLRSFLNRGKRFTLDNGSAGAAVNELRLPGDLTVAELYLWAWCEMYLRFERLVETHRIRHATELRTEDLVHPERVAAVFTALGLACTPIAPAPPGNTNESQGFGPTRVTPADIKSFEVFFERLSPDIRRRIRYFDNYDPWTANRKSLADAA